MAYGASRGLRRKRGVEGIGTAASTGAAPGCRNTAECPTAFNCGPSRFYWTGANGALRYSRRRDIVKLGWRLSRRDLLRLRRQGR